MRRLQPQRFLFYFIFIFVLSHSGTVFAGAWTQPQGHGQFIINGYYYTADERFDNNGNRQPLSPYNKYELNPYLEYGVSDAVTLGANLSLQGVTQQSSTGVLRNYGIGDSEFFARARLWHNDRFVISATSLIKLPGLFSARNQPKIGGDQPDAGLGLSGGYGFELLDQHHFIDVSALYRYRFGAPQDQVNLAATLGIGLGKRWTLLPQLFGTYRTETPQVAAFTQSSADDYDALKLQLSVAYQYNPAVTFQSGIFTDIDGANSGIGRGILFSVWRNF